MTGEQNQVLLIAREALMMPELELVVSEKWRSGKTVEFRQLLRDSLASKLAMLAPSKDPSSVRELSHLPEHPLFEISISHCRAMGGYVLVPKPHCVGFDIEEIARVKETVAERVTNAKDTKAPSAAHAWAAKEAIYKCLNSSHQPEVIADIAVHSWTLSKPEIFTFRAARVDSFPDPKGYGVAFKADQLIYSIFIQPSLN